MLYTFAPGRRSSHGRAFYYCGLLNNVRPTLHPSSRFPAIASANAFSQATTQDGAHTAPEQQPRGRGRRAASPFARVGQGERRAKLFTACQRTAACMHRAPRLFILPRLLLLEWLWARGKMGRAIAARAKLKACLRERLRQFALTGRTPATSELQESTHMCCRRRRRRSTHLTRPKQSSTDWLPEDASFASQIVLGHWLPSPVAPSRMSQLKAWPSSYTLSKVQAAVHRLREASH